MGSRYGRLRSAALGVGTALLITSAVEAEQDRRTGGSENPRKRTTATRVSRPPTIDGVLDEQAWQEGVAISDFVQAEPLEGQPASEQTEVRLLYDDRTLYIGVICYDSEPSRIIVTDSRRDTLGDGDTFQMIFDTYYDRQNGFVFGTNPAGVEYDAQVRNEGETQSSGPPTLGRVSAGSGGGLNVNWDGSWEVKTRITETGWTAEFRIPLRTLRYGPPPQTWGLNFSRNIRRKREQVYWSPVSRIYNLTRLSSAGELQNLSVAAPRNLQLMPYAIGSANRNFAPGSKNELNRDWGLDAKVGVTSSVNLDLTYNTDFAQVEVDEQQINLTRFNLVFPEKRPFFLENRGLFAVGKNGEVDLFFSRRIGIGGEGELLPIKGGARLTGRAGGVNVGLVNMQTGRIDEVAGNNVSAARISKDLPNRSGIGAIMVGRAGTGELAGDENWNRTWGVDGKWGIGEAVTFQGFAARTETPGAEGREYAYSSAFEFRNRAVRADLSYMQVGEAFNPEVGFLERTGGYRQVGAGVHRFLRSPGISERGFRELRPHITYEGFWNFNGLLETATLHMDPTLDWESGVFWSPAVNMQWEGLDRPFEISPGVIVPPGQYRNLHTAWQASSDGRRPISVSSGWYLGGFLSGRQHIVAPAITLRSGGTFTTSLRWTRSDIDLPQGAFVTNLGSLRMTYNMTTLMNAQALVQYNDNTRRWSTNLRFNWQQTAATGLYVVYNDTEALNGLGPVNRAFIVKYSYMFNVLN